MEIKDKTNEMLQTVLKTEKQIIPEQNLIEDLGMTSLDMMHLISLIEDEFDVVVPINEAIKIKLVGDLYNALENKDQYFLV